MKNRAGDIDQVFMTDIKESTANQSGLQVIDVPTPRLNLSSSDDVRREMSRVYREARSRSIQTSDATKLVFILTQILRAHEQVVLEARLTELESRCVA